MNVKKYFYKLIKTNIQHLEPDIDTEQSNYEVDREPKINIEIQNGCHDDVRIFFEKKYPFAVLSLECKESRKPYCEE